jgi:hypothetical protein
LASGCTPSSKPLFPCVATSDTAELVVEVRRRSCFGSTWGGIRLASVQGITTLRTEANYGRWLHPLAWDFTESPLETADRDLLVSALGGAAGRPDEGRCGSEEEVEVDLAWCCLGVDGEVHSGGLSLSSPECVANRSPETTLGAPVPYSRAVALARLVDEAVLRSGVDIEDLYRSRLAAAAARPSPSGEVVQPRGNPGPSRSSP